MILEYCHHTLVGCEQENVLMPKRTTDSDIFMWTARRLLYKSMGKSLALMAQDQRMAAVL